MSGRVTESLRRTWARQLAQFQEEARFTPAEDSEELEEDILLMQRLLALPLGATIPK